MKGRNFNFKLANTDWRGTATLAGQRVEKIPPQGTSKTCSRCGWTNQNLNGAKVFECLQCGLRIDRQLNAPIGMYRRTEGAPQGKAWWDSIVLPALLGGCLQTGDAVRDPDELVRGLYETMRPQTTYGYDRYADAYLPVSMRL